MAHFQGFIRLRRQKHIIYKGGRSINDMRENEKREIIKSSNDTVIKINRKKRSAKFYVEK